MFWWGFLFLFSAPMVNWKIRKDGGQGMMRSSGLREILGRDILTRVFLTSSDKYRVSIPWASNWLCASVSIFILISIYLIRKHHRQLMPENRHFILFLLHVFICLFLKRCTLLSIKLYVNDFTEWLLPKLMKTHINEYFLLYESGNHIPSTRFYALSVVFITMAYNLL